MVDIKAVQDQVRKADEEKAKAKSGFQRGYGGEHGHESSGAPLPVFDLFAALNVQVHPVIPRLC